MEAPDGDRNAPGPKLATHVERPRKLIGLNSYKRNQPTIGGSDACGNPGNVDDCVGLVIGFDLDFNVGTENAFIGALGEQAVDTGEAV